MTAFFVGQRVKLVRPCDPVNQDRTGVLSALFASPFYIHKDDPHPVNCNVRWDEPLGEEFFPYTHTSRLEPLVDDGRTPVAWSDCLWQPQAEPATA